MQEHKKEYLISEKELKTFYEEVEAALNKKDEIAKWTELMLKHGVIKMEGLNTNS